MNDHAATARQLVETRRWDEAFDAYAAADEQREQLTTEDLRSWSVAAYLLGRIDTATEALSRSFRIDIDCGQRTNALRSGFWLVFMLMQRGDVAQAGGWITRCTRLIAEEPDGSSGHGYMLLLEGFRKTSVEHDYEDGRRAAEQAAEIGRSSADDELVALALSVVGRAALRLGDSEGGIAALDEAMLSVVSTDVSPPAAGMIYCSLIEGCEEIGDLRRAREWTEALTRWCDNQRGMLTFTGSCLVNRATILRRRGRWLDAEAEAKRAFGRLDGAADQRATGRAQYELGEVYRVSGNHEAAEEAYRKAAEWGHDPQPGYARLRLAQGRTDAAAGAIRRLIAETKQPAKRTRLLPASVEIMLAAGDLAAASTGLRELRTVAATFGTSALVAEADAAEGRMLVANGETHDAVRLLRRACESWLSIGVPYEAARTRVLIGEACRTLGDEDTALMELESARRAFEELGASDDLRRLPSLQSKKNYGLTPRELEVLRLVSTGKTNQQIADELFVAVKTIDRHVANILAKLDVRSRTAATAFAFERDLI